MTERGKTFSDRAKAGSQTWIVGFRNSQLHDECENDQDCHHAAGENTHLAQFFAGELREYLGAGTRLPSDALSLESALTSGCCLAARSLFVFSGRNSCVIYLIFFTSGWRRVLYEDIDMTFAPGALSLFWWHLIPAGRLFRFSNWGRLVVCASPTQTLVSHFLCCINRDLRRVFN